MNQIALSSSDEEITALRLAREIAMNFNDIEQVLASNSISSEQFEKLKVNPYFTALLKSESAAWHAATNTNERVKLKAAAMVEEWLAEANARAHDSKETLSSKVELMKLIRSLTGMGVHSATESGGERLSVTINLGGDKLRYEKTVSPKVLEGTIAQEQ